MYRFEGARDRRDRQLLSCRVEETRVPENIYWKDDSDMHFKFTEFGRRSLLCLRERRGTR